MAIYRISRNIEASIVDFLTEEFAESGGYSNISVFKTFKKVYGLQMDVNKGHAAVCVRASTSRLPKIEIGTNAILRTVLVMLDVFATSDGQREDLKDFLIDVCKEGIPYYQYEVSGDTVASKVPSGYLRVSIDNDAPVNFNTDKTALDVHDRYRHALTLKVCTSQVEE